MGWQLWFPLAGMLLVGEMAGVGCYLLYFALASAATGLLALGGPSLEAQLAYFLVISGLQLTWAQLRLRRRVRPDPKRS
ncbi:MAG: NfeD family protein [Limnochordia bacterium]